MVMAEGEHARVAGELAECSRRMRAAEEENKGLKAALHAFQHQCIPAYQQQVLAWPSHCHVNNHWLCTRTFPLIARYPPANTDLAAVN